MSRTDLASPTPTIVRELLDRAAVLGADAPRQLVGPLAAEALRLHGATMTGFELQGYSLGMAERCEEQGADIAYLDQVLNALCKVCPPELTTEQDAQVEAMASEVGRATCERIADSRDVWVIGLRDDVEVSRARVTEDGQILTGDPIGVATVDIPAGAPVEVNLQQGTVSPLKDNRDALRRTFQHARELALGDAAESCATLLRAVGAYLGEPEPFDPHVCIACGKIVLDVQAMCDSCTERASEATA